MDPGDQDSLQFAENPPKGDTAKRSRYCDATGGPHGSGPVSKKQRRRPVQKSRGRLIFITVPKKHSDEDLLQPSNEKSNATPDKRFDYEVGNESEWLGVSPSDDDAVRQHSPSFIIAL